MAVPVAVQPSDSPKPNPTAPTVQIEVDGKTYTLLLDFNALVALEEETGKNVLDGATWNNVRLADLRAFLWAAMLHEEPLLRPEQVGRLIRMDNAQYLFAKLNELFDNTLPAAEAAADAAGVNPQSPGKPTGRRSGR